MLQTSTAYRGIWCWTRTDSALNAAIIYIRSKHVKERKGIAEIKKKHMFERHQSVDPHVKIDANRKFAYEEGNNWTVIAANFRCTRENSVVAFIRFCALRRHPNIPPTPHSINIRPFTRVW